MVLIGASGVGYDVEMGIRGAVHELGDGRLDQGEQNEGEGVDSQSTWMVAETEHVSIGGPAPEEDRAVLSSTVLQELIQLRRAPRKPLASGSVRWFISLHDDDSRTK